MRTKGFTLIELMIILAIISIITAIAIPNFLNVQARAREATTKCNCHTIQLAAEEFATLNDGVYAANVNIDRTLSNQTIIDLLPGGVPMMNLFTKTATEPVDAAMAANPGEIAYWPILLGADVAGYSITAAGQSGNIIQTYLR
jgi:prepilin-type N-terminal cleavage/methylation domain-containing protein